MTLAEKAKRKELIEKVDNALNSVGEKVLRRTVDFSNMHNIHTITFSTKNRRIIVYDINSHTIHDLDIYNGVRERYIIRHATLETQNDKSILAKACIAAKKASIVVKC